jgi:hypothetical protein
MMTTFLLFSSDVNSWQGNSDFDEALPSWDNDSVLSGQYDDGCVHNDVDHLDGLVSQPRRVCFYSIFLFFLLKDSSQSWYSIGLGQLVFPIDWVYIHHINFQHRKF